ncbi:MAG: RNA polymerase sigma factor [Phycisphaeraceae bacterium]|nr:RNA polymerase sigma factor [Phycisphaeraceae bacterium]
MANKRQQLEDQVLVMDAQDGDAEAMRKLVLRWQKPLWHHAYRLTGHEDAAWDVMQEAWHDMIKGLHKLHDPASFRAWAYKITTNKAMNWIKKKSRHQHVPLEVVYDNPARIESDTGLQELMGQLNAAKRVVLSLYYFEQLSVSEISFALRIPPGTVKSRLHAAREELKSLWLRQNNE